MKLSAELQRWRDLERQGRLSLTRPEKGWIRTVRDALCMSGFQLAWRMGVKQPTVAGLERNERDGTITLDTLRRAAEALGCDVVYAFVPRAPLLDGVERQAARAARHLTQRTRAAGPDAMHGWDVEDCLRELLVRSPGRIWGSHDEPELLRGDEASEGDYSGSTSRACSPAVSTQIIKSRD
ncbi:MAG: helix-turn-helix domain-containing protein [Longimicrobiales bacterium]